jgi:hypothetical protein
LVKALQLTGVFKSVLDTLKSKVKEPNYQEILESSLSKLRSLELAEVDKDFLDYSRNEAEAFFS